MYEVYVRTNGTAFYSEFCYSWLSILGKITVDGRNLDSTSSFVESVRSVTQCSPYNWTAAQLSIEKGGNFAFNIGDPFNPIWPEQLGQCIPLTFGSALLFSVIVHAPLGSTISSINTSTGLNPFVSVYGSNAKFINCKGEMLVTYGGAPNPTVVMPSPAACSSNISYSFNAPALQTFQGNFLDAVQVPILLTGIPTGTLIEEIEALVEVKTTNYMEYRNVQEMYLQASPNPFGAQTRLLLDLPHDDNVVMNIYNALGALVHTRTLSLSAGQQELFLQGNDVQNTPGVYQVALHSADKSISITIVKQ